MKKSYIRFLCLVFLFALMVYIPLPVLAVGNVTYNSNTHKFIFTPGTEENPTDLFDSLKQLMPGDVRAQEITIKNVSSSGKVRLYMRALPPTEEDIDFLSKLHLEVVLNENSILFDAPPSSTGALTEWRGLGTYYPGGSSELLLTLTVPIDLGDDYQNAEGIVKWEFRADELPLQAGDPGYKTGDLQITTILFGICLCSFCLMVVLILRRRKEQAQ